MQDQVVKRNRIGCFSLILAVAVAWSIIFILVKEGHCQTKLHGLTLTWHQSDAPIGFNRVYASTVSGGPYHVVYTSSLPITEYFIPIKNPANAGTIIYYVTTAVGTDGVESTYSNQVAFCPRSAIPSCLSQAVKSPYCRCAK